MFFLNLELVDSFKDLFFREEDSTSVSLGGDFKFPGIVLFEVEGNSSVIVSFDFGLNWCDFLGGVLRFFGLPEFFEAEFFFSFSDGFVRGQIGLNFGDAPEEFRVVFLVLSEPGLDGIDFGVIIE